MLEAYTEIIRNVTENLAEYHGKTLEDPILAGGWFAVFYAPNFGASIITNTSLGDQSPTVIIEALTLPGERRFETGPRGEGEEREGVDLKFVPWVFYSKLSFGFNTEDEINTDVIFFSVAYCSYMAYVGALLTRVF